MSMAATQNARKKKVPKRTFREGRLSEQAVSAIEAMIAEEFPLPGRRLPKEAELADRFAVSRMVIREAMKILEDRGLVEVRAGRGTCTVSPSPGKVKDSLLRLFRDQPLPAAEEMERLLELRGVLEETAAGLAAVRASNEELETMATALRDMGAASVEDDMVAADLRFHAALWGAARNRYFEIVLEPLMQVFTQQVKLTNSYSLGIPLHQDVFEAIRKRNPVAARQAVRRMMKATLEDTRNALQSLGTVDATSA